MSLESLGTAADILSAILASLCALCSFLLWLSGRPAKVSRRCFLPKTIELDLHPNKKKACETIHKVLMRSTDLNLASMA